MTFYSTLAGTDGHVDLVLAVRIEGIPVVFVERAIPAAVTTSWTGYTQFVGITRIEEGEAVLDLEERREKAASLEFDLLDDTARTLRSLFALNTQRKTFMNIDSSAVATLLGVSSSTGISAGQTVYTDTETILVGGTVAGGLTGCTRGAFGSTAAAIFGTATDGDSVYTTPPNWLGRRAYLYGYALTAAGGGEEQLLGTWIVDEPPRHKGDDAWSMTLASVAQEFYERSVGFNLEEAAILSAAVSEVGGITAVDLSLDNVKFFRQTTGFPCYALVSWDKDQAGIFEIVKEDYPTFAPLRIRNVSSFGTVSPNGSLVVGGFVVDFSSLGWATAKKARQISIVTGGPAAILYVLLSKEGQGINTWDKLPGRVAAQSNDPGWRMGAGFTTAEIDTTAWTAIEGSPSATIIIDGERKVSDLLREWCYLSGTATRVTYDGKLAPFTLAAPRQALTTTLSINSIVPDSRVEVMADEGAIAPLATVKVDYSPIEKDYHGQINTCDVTLSKRYGRAPRRREFEFRSFGCQDAARLVTDAAPFVHPSDLSVSEVPAIVADILSSESGKARLLVRLSLTMAHLDLRIGDVVMMSGLPDAFSSLPDMRGGTLEGAKARVVARRPRYNDGRVDVQLQILDPLLHVCPAAVIASAVGAVMTLSTTGPEVSGASPGDDFYVGAGVRIYDVSAGVSELRTVSARTSTTLTLSSAPTFVIAGGVDYLCLDPDFSSNGTTVSGYTLQEMATITDDAAVGGGPLFVSRWR